MRLKLFLRFFVVALPVALFGNFITEIGNRHNWQWEQWPSGLTISSILSSMAVAAVIAAVLVRLQPRSEAE